MPTPYLVGTDADYVGQASYLDGGISGGPNFQTAPFEYNGKTYVCYTNIKLDPDNPPTGTLGAFLAVSNSSDRQTFTVLDPTNAPETKRNGGYLSPSYSIVDLANSRVVFFSVALDGTLFCQTFDLSSGPDGAWGAVIASGGPTLGTNETNTGPQIVATMISATKFVVVYTASPNGIDYVILDTGVWGTPGNLVVSAGLTKPNGVILGATIDAGGFTFPFYSRLIYTGAFISSAQLCYNRIDSAGALLGEAVVTTEAPAVAIAFGGSVPKYLSSVNRIAFPCFTRFPGSCGPLLPNEWFIVWIDDPGGSPTDSVEGIGDSDDPLFTGPPYFFTDPAELQYYVGAEFIDDEGVAGPLDLGWEKILLWRRAPADSSWTGPNTFYDAQLNPPTGPTYVNSPDSPIPPAELNSVALAIYGDGTIAATVGMLSNVCGVEFFMSLPAGLITISATAFLPRYIAPHHQRNS